MSSLVLAFRFARRELRGGLSGFYLFLACIALGVAAIAAVGSVTAAFLGGMAEKGQELLGGDAEFRLTQRTASAEAQTFLDERARVARLYEMRGMARVDGTDTRTLVELKAVDDNYPLFGVVELAPSMTLADALAERDGVFGAVVEPNLLPRLGVNPGARIVVGNATFEIRAVIDREPDRVAGGFTLGPRFMISRDGLVATGLEQPGSLISYTYRIALPDAAATPADLSAFMQEIADRFPEEGWQTRDRTAAAPGIRRFIEQANLFLTLVGLATLIVGGVGVANAVGIYMERKTQTIAVMKCVGASSRVIFLTYLIQVLIIATAGIAIGLVLGALAPYLMGAVAGDLLPIDAELAVYPDALMLAAAYGYLTALAFALSPLARARDTKPARLFRDLVSRDRRWPRLSDASFIAAAFAGLGALAILFTPYKFFAVMVLIGVAFAFGVLRVMGGVIRFVARRLSFPRSPMLRLAMANLHRPGAATVSVTLSLGLALSLIALVALIDGNIRGAISTRLPGEAPSFFFIDIQSADQDRFRALLEETGDVTDIRLTPMLRGRITHLNGVKAEDAEVDPGSRWALSGDRGVTYSAAMPEGTNLVGGEWWPLDYAGPPLVSFDAALAEGLGLKLGDTVTINLLGRSIMATISSLRRIDYTTANMNFVFVLSPGVLERAPHTVLGTARAPIEQEEAIERAVARAFPNVSVVRVKQAIETANEFMDQLAIALRATSAVMLVAGLIVLAGALAAGYRRRVYDNVLLKVLGAERRRLLFMQLAEFALLGAGAASVAALLAFAAAWAIISFIINVPFKPDFAVLAATILGGALTAMILGLATNLRALSQPSARILRAP
ncbi:MAG TPA: FtsX-like permease family protein [Micropepsaceae bacterium]|nr:FtsX-like permease family protein [Micropepsaceae bacterium]